MSAPAAVKIITVTNDEGEIIARTLTIETSTETVAEIALPTVEADSTDALAALADPYAEYSGYTIGEELSDHTGDGVTWTTWEAYVTDSGQGEVHQDRGQVVDGLRTMAGDYAESFDYDEIVNDCFEVRYDQSGSARWVQIVTADELSAAMERHDLTAEND